MSVQKTKATNSFPQIVLSFWPLFLMLAILLSLLIYDSPTTRYSVFNRTWGFNHIMFYSFPFRLGFLLICLTLIIPYSNSIIVRWIEKTSAVIVRLNKWKFAFFLFISVLSCFCFYLFRVKYYFLGDFNLRLQQTMRQEFVKTEFLTMKLLYYFAISGHKIGFTDEQMFKLYSYLAGGCFVFVSFLIADITGKNIFQKLFVFLAQAISAVALVFCGYVEVYCTPVLFLTLFIYTSLRCLKYEGYSILFPAAILIVAISSHLLCVAAIPAFLVLIYFKCPQRIQFIYKIKKGKLVTLIPILVIATVTIGIASGNSFLLPLSAPISKPATLTLFSLKHIWEFLNGQLLACGLNFILLFYLLVKIIRDKIKLLAEHYYLLGLVVGLLLLVLTADLQRGSADWDIMAFPSLSLNILTPILTFYIFQNTYKANYLMGFVITFSALNAILWIHINHSDRSIQKIKSMLENDPANYYISRLSGRLQLAVLYQMNNLQEESELMAKEACNNNLFDDVRPCIMFAESLKARGQRDQVAILYEDLLKNKTPYILEAYLYLLDYYDKKGDNERFIHYLNIFYDSFNEQPHTFLNNIRFKQEVMIGYFQTLLNAETTQKNIPRMTHVQNTIIALQNLKAVNATQ